MDRTSQLKAISDQAYGEAVSTGSDYHAGVEELAGYLLGRDPSPRIAALLREVGVRAELRAAYDAHRGSGVA